MVFFTDINSIYMVLAMAPVAIAPFVLPAVGLGLQGLSALFNRESKESKAAKKAQTRLANQQVKLGKARGERETTLFDTATPLIGQLIPQLQALLTGDRGALTQRFAPQLEALSGQRQGAEDRILASGPGSGAQVQGPIELEKSNFAARNALLSSAPKEAQAGLQQLIQLLLGGSSQQGAGATAASGNAGAGFESLIAGNTADRTLNANLLAALSEGAEEFGALFAKPEKKVFNV